jgi:hypothetical protein
MAAALPFCLLNYFLEGWIADMLDHYYLDSFRIMILLLVVFNLLVSASPPLLANPDWIGHLVSQGGSKQGDNLWYLLRGANVLQVTDFV